MTISRLRGAGGQMRASLMVCDNPGAADQEREEFVSLVTRVLARGLDQIEQSPLPESDLVGLANALLSIGREGGWARRFGDLRAEIAAEEINVWSRRLAEIVPARAAVLGPIFKQVLKSCFQPSPDVCRNSFREVDSMGRSRRQEHAYDLKRVSGAHCVDCPYWTEKTEGEHLAWLRGKWYAGAADLEAGRAVYLPEDFRALRRWRPGCIS